MATEGHRRRVFEGSLEQLAAIRTFVNEAVSELGGGEEDKFACELACDEAAANIYNHAFQGARGKVSVELWREGKMLVVQLNYQGRAFDPSRVPEPDLEAPLDERPSGGLGMYFMRQLMSQVDFDFDALEGNCLTMRRALAA